MAYRDRIMFDDLEWPSRSFTYWMLSSRNFLYSCAADYKISIDTARRAVSLL